MLDLLFSGVYIGRQEKLNSGYYRKCQYFNPPSTLSDAIAAYCRLVGIGENTVSCAVHKQHRVIYPRPKG